MQRILTRREKLILYITAGVIVFALTYNYLIAPFAQKNAALNKRIILAGGKLNTYRRLLAQKDYLREKYNKLYSSFKASGREEDTLVGALSQLEGLAKEAGIYIVDIRPQVSAGINPQEEVIISLKAEGAIEGYLKFIYSIEHSALLLKIKKIQLSVKPNSQALEGSFSVSFLSAGSG
jgi:hypothetical protein